MWSKNWEKGWSSEATNPSPSCVSSALARTTAICIFCPAPTAHGGCRKQQALAPASARPAAQADSSHAQASSSAGGLTQALVPTRPLAESPIFSPLYQELLSLVYAPCSPARAEPFPPCPSPGHCRPSLNGHPLCAPQLRGWLKPVEGSWTPVCWVLSFPTHIHSIAPGHLAYILPNGGVRKRT